MSTKRDQQRGPPISIRLSGDDLYWARHLADIEGRTIGRWAANAIRFHIDQHRAANYAAPHNPTGEPHGD